MKNLIIVISMLFIISNAYTQKKPADPIRKSFSYKIIPANGKTWGYDIYNRGKLTIHQPTIPAIPGNTGFASKAAAAKVAKKIINKIEDGQNPPAISIDEMKQLGTIPKK